MEMSYGKRRCQFICRGVKENFFSGNHVRRFLSITLVVIVVVVVVSRFPPRRNQIGHRVVAHPDLPSLQPSYPRRICAPQSSSSRVNEEVKNAPMSSLILDLSFIYGEKSIVSLLSITSYLLALNQMIWHLVDFLFTLQFLHRTRRVWCQVERV